MRMQTITADATTRRRTRRGRPRAALQCSSMLPLVWLTVVSTSSHQDDSEASATGLLSRASIQTSPQLIGGGSVDAPAAKLGLRRSAISHAQGAIETKWERTVRDPNAPRGFRLALTGSNGEMLLSWTSLAASASAQTLRYGLTNTSLPYACKPEVVILPQDPSTVTLRCVMVGLAPYTHYYYAVQQFAAAYSAVASFVSPPTAGEQFTEYPLRIIAFGDVDWTDGHPGDPVGSNPSDVGNSRRVTAAACRDVAFGHPKGTGIGAPRPPFNATLALHVGDISYSGPNSEGNTTLGAMLWDVFLAEQECLSSVMPYMVAPGNHDVCPVGIDIDGYTGWCGGDSGWECGSEYLARYQMPGANYSAPADGYNETRDCLTTYHSVAARYWHSYTYGPIRFVVVSTEHDFSPGSPQLLWLTSELATIDRKATPWVIVYGHRPTYCSGIYLNQCGEEGASHYMAATLRRRMEPLFVNANVDLVLWGHEHAYERIHPTINGTVVGRSTTNPTAPINLVLGMGGADNSYMGGWREPPPDWIAHREMSFGHGRITLLSSTELHFEYVAVDGVVHDDFFLTKGGR